MGHFHQGKFVFFVMVFAAQASRFSVAGVPPSEPDTEANIFWDEERWWSGGAVFMATPGDEVTAEQQPARSL
jgi:hypothetical protein